jgi:hypothetical protein
VKLRGTIAEQSLEVGGQKSVHSSQSEFVEFLNAVEKETVRSFGLSDIHFIFGNRPNLLSQPVIVPVQRFGRPLICE